MNGRKDEPKTWRPTDPYDHLQATQLSPPFVSEISDEWVVVISTPVWDEQRGQKEYLGVVGLMVRLGAFAKLPGNELAGDAETANDSSFTVLVDSRETPGLGHILQHPIYSELDDRRPADHVESERRKVLNRSQQEESLQVPLDAWKVNANYRDPLAAASSKYDQRWLASQLPVKVRGQDTGLRVIVQESYDQNIGQPLSQMRRGLILLSLITFGLSAAVIVPLWGLILRLVR